MDERTGWNRRRRYRDEDDYYPRSSRAADWRGDPGREPMTGRWDEDEWDRSGWFDYELPPYPGTRAGRSQSGYGRPYQEEASYYGGRGLPPRESMRSSRMSENYPRHRHPEDDYAWNYGSSPEEQYYHGFGGHEGRRPYSPSYGPGSYSPTLGPGSSRDDYRRSRSERGFMDRAADEVASWFGDEDAERRREQDHRGRGPSGYTRSDERIREDVHDRLTDSPYVDASNVSVTVEKGEVTLDGTVTSRAQKREAEDCVDDISGVRHVQNNLRVADYTGTSEGPPTTFSALDTDRV
jgi:osmotically-inducible protein OsmY